MGRRDRSPKEHIAHAIQWRSDSAWRRQHLHAPINHVTYVSSFYTLTSCGLNLSQFDKFEAVLRVCTRCPCLRQSEVFSIHNYVLNLRLCGNYHIIFQQINTLNRETLNIRHKIMLKSQVFVILFFTLMKYLLLISFAFQKIYFSTEKLRFFQGTSQG